MPQTAGLGQTDDFKSTGAGSRSFGGTCGEHRNNRTKNPVAHRGFILTPKPVLNRLFGWSPKTPPNALEHVKTGLKSMVCPRTAF